MWNLPCLVRFVTVRSMHCPHRQGSTSTRQDVFVHPWLHLQPQRKKFHLLVTCHIYPVGQSGSLFPISRWLQVEFTIMLVYLFGLNLCLFIDIYQSFGVFIWGLLMAINADFLESIQDELDLLWWSGWAVGGPGELWGEGMALGVES